MPRFDVVGIGVAACDYLTRLDRLPGLDEKVRSPDLVISGGGTVGNALVTVSRLGRVAAFAGTVGDDEFGRLILDGLEVENVDTELVIAVPGARSPFSFCVSIPPHRNVFSVAPTTPPLELTAAAIEHVLDTGFVHLDGSEEAVSLEVAREARRRGVAVSLDFQRVRASSDELLGLADIAVVSESFARERFPEKSTGEAVRALWRPGMRLAAITLGERGTVACEGVPCYEVPAEKVEVVDTIGAGDVFHGALLVGLLAGHTMRASLELATRVAALSCRELGGRAGIPLRDEVGEWL